MPFSKTGILPAGPGRFHETGKAGGMAEWSKAAVLKTVNRKVRGFESCSLRHRNNASNGGPSSVLLPRREEEVEEGE